MAVMTPTVEHPVLSKSGIWIRDYRNLDSDEGTYKGTVNIRRGATTQFCFISMVLGHSEWRTNYGIWCENWRYSIVQNCVQRY